MSARQLPAPNDRVKLEIGRWDNDGTDCLLIYSGSAPDLIAAGVATADMLAAGIKGQRRKDSDGDWCSRNLSRGVRMDSTGNPEVVERFKVYRWKPAERARLMPGVAEWLATEEKKAESEASTRPIGAPYGVLVAWCAIGARDTKVRDRAIGRYQRLARWTAIDNLIVPDWGRLVAARLAAQPPKIGN